MPADAEVLCIGETMLLVAPEDGGALSAQSLCLLRPAGAESNVAVHLAALGHRAAWASRLGTDPLGALVLEQLARSGVDVFSVQRRSDRPTGVFFKNPGPAGTSVHYYRAGSAASTMDPAFATAIGASTAPFVHLTGITPALSPECAALMDALLGDQRPARVSFDVNYRPALWGPDAPERLLHYARLADIVFVGRDEAQALWGTATAAEIRALIGDRGSVVVKDADIEAVSFTPSGETREPARRVEVLEPVGAGDAFAAGWLAGMLRGLDDRRRLRLGHLVAASVLTSTSDHGVLPSDRELADALGIDLSDWRRGRQTEEG